MNDFIYRIAQSIHNAGARIQLPDSMAPFWVWKAVFEFRSTVLDISWNVSAIADWLEER